MTFWSLHTLESKQFWFYWISPLLWYHWSRIMINRLKGLFGITGVVLKWFMLHLCERSFTVCMYQVLSETSVLPCGVPQWFVSGWILFLLYIIPLGQIIRRCSDSSYHLCADDIQLYCSFKASKFYQWSCLNNCQKSNNG